MKKLQYTFGLLIKIFIIVVVILVSIVVFILWYFQPRDSILFSTDHRITDSSLYSKGLQPFSEYIDTSKSSIRKGLESQFKEYSHFKFTGYTSSESLDFAVSNRSPFERCTSVEGDSCANTYDDIVTGFLLIHGLTDSPYLLSDIANSLRNKFDNSVARAIVLPGHATAVGDSIKMHRDEWLKSVKYGVESFKDFKNLEHLFIVGFSTGTSLAIRYVQDNKIKILENNKVKGLVLISPAITAKTSAAFFAQIASFFADWTVAPLFGEKDAVRYEQFSWNAGSQFYKLTKNILTTDFKPDIPVFMVVSEDDNTIDAENARRFFNDKVEDPRSRLIWYRSAIESESKINDKITIPNCKFDDGMPQSQSKQTCALTSKHSNSEYEVLSMSHTALPIKPENPHYGFKTENGEYAKYSDCKMYTATETFNKCISNENLPIFYSETSKEILEKRNCKIYNSLCELHWKGRPVRRGTFNPSYNDMENLITAYITNVKRKK